MKKILLTALSLTFISSSALAAEVSMTIEKQQPVIHFNAEGEKFAVFQRFNDVWLVFNSKINKALPASLMAEPAIGLVSQEKLTVSGNGSGIRLSFKENKSFYLQKNNGNYTLKIGTKKSPKSKAILNIVSLQEGIRLSGKNISKFLTAHSMQTGERYTVMPMDIINSQQRDTSFYPIKFLKTLSGRAFTATNGELIDLIPQNGEYLIFTSPKHKVKVNKYAGNRAILNEINAGVPINFRDPEFMDMFATGVDGTTQKAQKSFSSTLSLLTEAINRVDSLPTPQDGKSLYKRNKIFDELEARIADKPLLGGAPVALPDAAVLLPRYTKVGEKDFRRFERKFLKRLRGITTEKSMNEGRLQLAKLAFAFKRYAEAGALLKKIPMDDQDPSILAQTKILRGAAFVLTSRAKEAIPLLIDGKHLEADRLVWLASAYEQLGEHEKATKLFKENIDASRAYPPHLQIKIRLSEAKSLFAQENITRLEKRVFDMERLVPDGDIPATAKLLLAKGYLLKEKYEEAEKLLSEVSQSNHPEAAFMAQYEFVIHLLDHGELTKTRALAHLEDLRFLWRGGKLEQDILYRLGTMYLNEEDYRKGLDRLKYYTIYFSNSPIIEDIAHKMTDSFNKIFFDKKAMEEKDPLEILGLYYDFRELTPPGEKGDQLIAKVGDELRMLGLFERATKLVKHQLNFRTKSLVEKAKLGKQLAELYLLNLKYKKGLAILEKTESKHIPNEVVQQRTIIKGRLLMASGNTAKAHDILMTLVDHKAQKLHADLAWEEKKYKSFIPVAEKILSRQSTPEKWVAEDHINFARLVFAYGITNKLGKVKAIEKKYPLYVAQENIAQIFTFLKQDKEYINIDNYKNKKTNWAQIIQHMDTYNDFTNQYARYYDAREKEKKSRKYFNKRMGQPSAPSRM
jgi:thioredoxin-like negative regulator of GroEL